MDEKKNSNELTDTFIKNGNYELLCYNEVKLGEGNYGQVFKVSYRGSIGVWDEFEQAVRKIKVEARDEMDLLEKVKTYSSVTKLRDKRTVRYYDVWLENDFTIKDGIKTKDKCLTLYIRMELCDKSLSKVFEMLRDDRDLIETGVLSRIKYFISCGIFIEMLEGLSYLHKQNPQIIHKYLCPENVFLKFDNDMEKWRTKNSVKIADFGLEIIHTYVKSVYAINRGHINYWAPEVIANENYDTKADTYSAGMILKDLLDINRNGTEDKVNTDSVTLMSKHQNMRVLLNKMISKNANERPSCEEILQNKQTWALTAQECYSEKEVGKLLNSRNNNKWFYHFMMQQFYKKGY